MNSISNSPLPMPHNWNDGVAELCIQEKIHGHRLSQDQEPYMIVLETLAVCADKPLGDEVASSTEHENFSYELPHRKQLRFLLFQDTQMEIIAQDVNLSDVQKWEKWKSHINTFYKTDGDEENPFSYLDENFKSNFTSLYQAICLLKSMKLDVTNKRRPTSQFLSVLGPDMICTDMRVNPKGGWSPDRRFFARGGELVYLMLNRSSLAVRLKELIGDKFLDDDNEFNLIAKALSGKNTKPSTVQIGYLPYSQHVAYDRMAEDWNSILSLNALPIGHHFEPIFRMTALNLLTYLGEQAHNELGQYKIEPIVADFMDGADTQFARYSKGNLSKTRELFNRSVDAHVNKQLENTQKWNTAKNNNHQMKAIEAICDCFKVNKDKLVWKSFEDLIGQTVKIGQERGKNNAHDFLLPLTKNSGIAEYRSGIGTWFNISDDMIHALVLSNVTTDIELDLFLRKIFQRYGLVIGPKQAEEAFVRPRVDITKFESNLVAFESRLSQLSLAKRHSDDCAIVINPYK